MSICGAGSRPYLGQTAGEGNDLVLFLGRNAVFLCHILSGLDHAVASPRIVVEVIPDPIFGIGAAAGSQGIWICQVRPI